MKLGTVIIPGVVWCCVLWCCVVFLTDTNTTPTKVVLSCFGLLIGLWQLRIASDLPTYLLTKLVTEWIYILMSCYFGARLCKLIQIY